jgi:hypothetical protein
MKDGQGWLTAVRLEGRPETVAVGIESLRAAGEWPELLMGEESLTWWTGYLSRQSIANAGPDVLLRCGAVPKEIASKGNRLIDVLKGHDISPQLVAVSPGLGTMLARFDPAQAGMATLGPLQEALLQVADSVTVMAAPPEFKRDIDIWGRVPETIGVMRALKAEFDPNGVLNPGRFVDRI